MTMKKKLLSSFIAFTLILCLTACSTPFELLSELAQNLSDTGTSRSGRSSGAKKDDEADQFDLFKHMKETPAPAAGGDKAFSAYAVSFVSPDNTYTALSFQKNAPDYTIAADLSNIENLDQFSHLTKEQKAMIAQNGFVVVPTDAEQLFYIYEENTYKVIPNFVTADSVLQLYHIYYDYALRNVETGYFYQDTVSMNRALLDSLVQKFPEIKDSRVKEAMARVIGYFSVSGLLLGLPLPDGIDSDTEAMARQEYRLITEASVTADSPIAGIPIDYTLFRPRGHYTRSEELTKYFLAFSWYGIVPFTFYKETAREEDNALCAMLIATALQDTPEAEKIWNTIYATTSFMVGNSDDLMPCEISALLEQLYGHVPAPDELPDKLDAFYQKLPSLRSAQIISKQASASTELQMRFMGQRYIADSEILQELCDPESRPFPTGLDVFAVYGSERAEALLNEIYQPNVLWPDYQKHFNELAQKFRNRTLAEQTSNVYNGWLFVLNRLAETKGTGYPFFMKNDAWMNKSLTTALGSWAELRHDTILYGKQSGAECGGGEEPPEVIGYVEPDPEFFHRLIWLTETTRDGLDSRNVLSNELLFKTETMLNMLTFLETCAVKELKGEDLSAEERYTLLVYGGTLEYISSSIAEADGWYMIESDTDRNMAVIADVHTTLSGYLEEGVGHACEIYVAVPQNGRVYLTRGAVFDYYEFSSTQRLTDEEWQRKLRQDPPERVPYSHTFMDENSAGEIPDPDTPYTTGC